MTSRYRLDQLLPRSVVVAERHQRTVDAPPERGLAGQVWKPAGDEAARVGNGVEFTARPGGTLVETGTRVFAMVDRAPRSIRARSMAWPRATMWAGYLSAAWALMFAGPHVVWGVGGSAGLDTALNREVIEHRSGWFLALNWGIGLCCVAGAAVALATVRPRGYPVPARLLRGLAWLVSLLLAARALDIYVEFGRNLTGTTTIPSDQRDEYLRLARWFLFLWLPWFTLGAVIWGALATRIHQHHADAAWTVRPGRRPPARPQRDDLGQLPRHA